MSTEIEYPTEQTATSRVGDILGDLHHLVTLQFQLTRREIEEELRQRATAVAMIALGIGILFLGGIMLCLSGVYSLHWLATPPGTDLAWLPLWSCHAVMAMVLAAVGGTLAVVGRARLRSINPRQYSAAELIKEPVLWKTPQK